MKKTIHIYMLAATAAVGACASEPGTDDQLDDELAVSSAEQGLSGAARRPRSERIREVAAERGLTNGVLLAGIAQVEVGLSHCWSEATHHCKGPHSSYCGGPVVAGSWDGTCAEQKGGLGMFQFDGGTHSQTLERDGTAILSVDGSVSHAVDFVVGLVRRHVSGIDSRAEALTWMNGIVPSNSNARFREWKMVLSCWYNGRCTQDQADKYGDSTLNLYSEFGSTFWQASRETATVGDVNGDGRADIVSLHNNGNTYTWLANTAGGYGTAVPDGGNTFDSSLVDNTGHLVVGVADVNGDRRSDLVTVHDNGTAYVYLGTASGAFGTRTESFAGTMWLPMIRGTGHDPIAVADVTGDGRADLITHNTNGNVYVYPGTASGTFGGGVASGAGSFNSALRDGVGHWFVGAADVNGDGRADLVTLFSDGTAYTYLGTASGAFVGRAESFEGTMLPTPITGRAGHLPVGLGDVNGDGRADLVTHNTNGNVYVYKGQTSGAFAGGVASFAGTMLMAQFGAPGHQVIAVLDANGDDKADLVTAQLGSLYVYKGSSTGAFSGMVESFDGTLDSSWGDDSGHEMVQMGPFYRRRPCATTGCRVR